MKKTTTGDKTLNGLGSDAQLARHHKTQQNTQSRWRIEHESQRQTNGAKNVCGRIAKQLAVV
jgi:transposase-like protein